MFKNLKLDELSISKYLIMICLAVLAFGLTGQNILFNSIAFIVGVFALLATTKMIGKDDIKSIAPIGIPLIIFVALAAFGPIHNTIFGVMSGILFIVGVAGALFMGIGAKKNSTIKIQDLLLVAGVALALLVLISMVATWVNYGLFYRLVYKNTPTYYYGGVMYNIMNEAMFLNGFKLIEMEPAYVGLFSTVLCAYLPGLLFINPKENKKEFIITLCVGIIGLINLITMPYFFSLILVLLVFVAAACYKFLRNNKNFRKGVNIGLVTLAVIALSVFILLILKQQYSAIGDFISGNKILNKLLNNNRLVAGPSKVIKYIFTPECFFGIPTYISFDDVVFADTGMIEIEILKEGGIFALLGVIAFIVFAVLAIRKYLTKSKDSEVNKITILSILIGYFLATTIDGTMMPNVHFKEYVPMISNPLFLIIIFIIGYVGVSDRTDVLIKDEIVVKKQEDPKDIMEDIEYEEI